MAEKLKRRNRSILQKLLVVMRVLTCKSAREISCTRLRTLGALHYTIDPLPTLADHRYAAAQLHYTGRLFAAQHFSAETSVSGQSYCSLQAFDVGFSELFNKKWFLGATSTKFRLMLFGRFRIIINLYSESFGSRI